MRKEGSRQRRGEGRHTHEQVICVGYVTPDTEEFHQVVELAVDVTTYLLKVSYWSHPREIVVAFGFRTVTGAQTVTTLASSISSSRAL